jgi:hypothetical protein
VLRVETVLWQSLLDPVGTGEDALCRHCVGTPDPGKNLSAWQSRFVLLSAEHDRVRTGPHFVTQYNPPD